MPGPVFRGPFLPGSVTAPKPEGGAARADRAVAQVVGITLVADGLREQPLPELPHELSDVRGAILGDALYLAGRDGQGGPAFWRIAPRAKMVAWERLPAWPAGAATSLSAQAKALYLSVPGAAGAATAAGAADRLYRFAPQQGWASAGAVPGRVVAPMAHATGQAHLLYLLAGSAAEPGGAKLSMHSLHTITGAWASQARLGQAVLADGVADDGVADDGVASNGGGAPLLAAPWPDGLAWARSDGAGRTTLHHAELSSGKLLLQWLDWIVVAVYLVAVLGIGLYFYLREKRDSTADFFVGGRSIPFWAAGISLYATNTSSISFIAIPAKAFESNWQYMTNNLVAVIGLTFVAVWIVPMLRRLDLMSVFSYLETRFHPGIRMIASALCIVTQIGSRMSVVLYLPALAIATITGIDVVWSVLIMGGFTILYTAMGGMKAVIWTDVVQVVAMMGGALFAVAFAICHIDGGTAEFMRVAMDDHKLRLLDFSFDLTQATVWGFIFLVLFDVVLTFPKDQVLMQRVLSTKSATEAGRSIWAFAAIMIPGGFIFYGIGTALYVYYKAHPERMNPLLSIDATFPLYIAAELPMGVTGLIIAGIFAAAMSTLSSIINSVATMASVDFLERLVAKPSPRASVIFAEVVTVVAGLVGIAAALLLARFDVRSMFDVSIELAGLLGGGFAGAYTLGMFTRRANSAGVAIGIGCSIVLTTLAWSFSLVHPYFYLAISIMLCIIFGYLASLLFPAPTRSLAGLTIFKSEPPATPLAKPGV